MNKQEAYDKALETANNSNQDQVVVRWANKGYYVRTADDNINKPWAETVEVASVWRGGEDGEYLIDDEVHGIRTVR